MSQVSYTYVNKSTESLSTLLTLQHYICYIHLDLILTSLQGW